MSVFVGEREYFPGVKTINFEGRDSENPLAFKYYDPEKLVGGKKMRDHLRFAVAYWRSFCNVGDDPFGPGTHRFPWANEQDALAQAEARLDAAFEQGKLGLADLAKLAVQYGEPPQTSGRQELYENLLNVLLGRTLSSKEG